MRNLRNYAFLVITAMFYLLFSAGCGPNHTEHKFKVESDILNFDPNDSSDIKICNLRFKAGNLKGKRYYFLDHPSLSEGQTVYFSSFEGLKIPLQNVKEGDNTNRTSALQEINFALIQSITTSNLPCPKTNSASCIPYLSDSILDQLKVVDTSIYQIVIVSYHQPSHYETIEAIEFPDSASYDTFRLNLSHTLPNCKNFAPKDNQSPTTKNVLGTLIKVYQSNQIEIF